MCDSTSLIGTETGTRYDPENVVYICHVQNILTRIHFTAIKQFNSPEVRFELQGEGLGRGGEHGLHGVHLQHNECS